MLKNIFTRLTFTSYFSASSGIEVGFGLNRHGIIETDSDDGDAMKKPTSWLCWLCSVVLLGSFVSVLPTQSAFAAGCKVPKTYYKHVSCTAKRGYFLAVTDSGAPVALIDRKGKQKVDLRRYKQVATYQISEGLMPVQRGNKLGYVNMYGKEVIPTRYDILRNEVGSAGWARAARNGRIVVKKNGKYGVITTTNRVIVPFSSKYAMIEDYRSGKTVAKLHGNEQVMLDKNGRKIQNLQATNKSVTRNNRNEASRQQMNRKQSAQAAKQANTIKAKAKQKATQSAAANKQQARQRQTPPPAPKVNVIVPLTEQYIPIMRVAKRQGKWGFVDMSNKVMIQFIFDDARAFSQGIAGVKQDDKWGFIDLAGNLVIDFKFTHDDSLNRGQDYYLGKPSFTFMKGKAWVGYTDTGERRCIDLQGDDVVCDEL